MRPTTIILGSALGVIALVNSSAWADNRASAYTFPKWGMPDSPEDSKKIGGYIAAAKTNPGSFTIDNHRVEISESWVQRMRSGSYGIFFAIKIDGDRKGEHRLRKQGTVITFRPTEETSTSYGWYGTHAIRNVLLGIPSGEYIHYLFLSDPTANQVTVRVGTYAGIYPKFDLKDDKAKFTDVSINFVLPDKANSIVPPTTPHP
jgi:hypothetical protein